MTLEIFLTILTIIVPIIGAVIGYFVKRTLSQFDKRIDDHIQADSLEMNLIKSKIEHNEKVTESLNHSNLLIKQNVDNLNAILHNIEEKVNKLVSSDSFNELKNDISGITRDLREFLIRDGKTEIKIQVLEEKINNLSKKMETN